MDISGVNEKGNAKVFCSFCEKPSDELTHLVASKFAAICSDCIVSSVKIIAGKTNHHTATSADISMTAGIDEKKPYPLSEQVVLDMWLGVKLQAENQIDFLFANHDAEDKKAPCQNGSWSFSRIVCVSADLRMAQKSKVMHQCQ